MRQTILAAALVAAFSAPTLAFAQAAPAAAAAAPASPHTFTANIGLYTDYRFRGITQTFGKPAIQGGFDYSHASGFYLGNWNSNVSETAGYPGGNLEMDFYGGWKNSWNDWGLDVGVLHYYYPGTTTHNGTSFYSPARLNVTPARIYTGDTINNTELYIAGSWKFITLKYSHAVSDYFKTPDTKGSNYLDLSASYDLGEGWGVNGHIGHLNVKNYGEASYTDYKLGVTKDIGGYVFGASYVTTNARDDCSASSIQPYCFLKNSGAGPTYAGGKSALVLSVSRTF